MSRWIQRRDCAIYRALAAASPGHNSRAALAAASASAFSCYSFAQATRPGRRRAILCESCEVQSDWADLPLLGRDRQPGIASVCDLSENRYEFGVFAYEPTAAHLPGTRGAAYASPYWGASLSRRGRCSKRSGKGICRIRVGGKNPLRRLSVTRWDFASQLGLRFPAPHRAIGEGDHTHWSNVASAYRNHGQDFATLTVRLNSDCLAS